VAEPALGREAQVALATETLADDFWGSETIHDLDFRGHTGSRGKIWPHHWWTGLAMHRLDESCAKYRSEDTGFPFGNVHKMLELEQDRVDHALERPGASGNRCRSFKCRVSEMLVGNVQVAIQNDWLFPLAHEVERLDIGPVPASPIFARPTGQELNEEPHMQERRL